LSTSSQKISNKENKKKLNNILSTLGVDNQSVKTNEADKILLNLIKSKDSHQKQAQQQQPSKCNDLLEILNTKKEQYEQSRQKSNNILENLFPNKTSPQQQVVPQMPPQPPKHFPLVLTAQELEMSQLLTQQKQNKPKLPNATSDLNRFDDLSNTSDAYKQLVKNLSNHPLNSSSTSGSIISKLNQSQPVKQQQWSNDGTNVLRQLLNLNPDNTLYKQQQQQQQQDKKSKKKHHHHHHHHHSKPKSPSVSMLTSNQFPAQNPHEKPFENYFGEENKDNSKHVEIVVASTLNHVLNKSPSTQANKNTLENLFEKMNMQQQQQQKRKPSKSENDHFNSLLNKMMPHQQQQQQQQHQQDKKTDSSSSSDILKWFTGSVPTMSASSNLSPNVLSEIEFMEMHQPKVLNKLC